MFPSPDEPDETSELADDLTASINDLADELEQSTDDDGNDMSAMGLPGMGFGSVISMVSPAIASKATEKPEAAERALAIIALESRALIEKHSDADEPEDLL